MAERTSPVYLEIPCEIEYAKVFEFNRDKKGYRGKHERYGGAYTVDAIMSSDAYKALKDSGSQKQGKVWDEEEEKWVKGSSKELRSADRIKVSFERKHEAPYTYGGPPRVVHADGSSWDTTEDGLIGNGSKGFIFVTVYEMEIDGEQAFGTRLDVIQVTEHVEYESDYDPNVTRGHVIPDRSGGSQPKPEVKKASKKAVVDQGPLEDDEIPF